MTANRGRQHGFTIVELLVVVSIIGLLMAVLLPAINGARQRARKMEEGNRIRQVGIAWNLYANANNDAALPGYLDEDLIMHPDTPWDVSYTMPDKKTPVETAAAQPWTWRLMPFLDYSHDVVRGYLQEDETSRLAMLGDTAGDQQYRMEIAEHPAFGYNAYYTGGWREYRASEDTQLEFHWHRFRNAKINGHPAAVVVRSPSQIRDSSRYLVFCSSGLPTPEKGPGVYRRVDDFHLGSHYIVPPYLAEESMWWLPFGGGGDNQWAIDVFGDHPFPIGRHTGQAMVLHADLHTQQYVPGTLIDRSYWINSAGRKPPDTGMSDEAWWQSLLHTE